MQFEKLGDFFLVLELGNFRVLKWPVEIFGVKYYSFDSKLLKLTNFCFFFSLPSLFFRFALDKLCRLLTVEVYSEWGYVTLGMYFGHVETLGIRVGAWISQSDLG